MPKEKILDKSFLKFQAKLNQGATPDLQLPDVEVMLGIEGAIRDIETSGEEFSTGQQKSIISSPVRFENGVLNFVGFNYPLELMFGPPVTIVDAIDGLAIDGSTFAVKRVYEPSATGRPNYASFDYGDPAGRFQRAVDVFLNSLNINCTLEETAYDAEGMGQSPLDSVLDSLTPAGSTTLIPQKTPDPLRGSLYGAASASALDTASAYQDAFTFALSIGGRWAPKYVMNEEAQGNYNATLRKRPDTRESSILLEENADAWAFFTRAKNNEFWYVRYEVRGDQLAAGTAEVQTVDLSGADDPNGGTWDLTILGFTLTGIAWDVSAATLQALIRSIVRWGAKDVTVGKVGFVYTITFPAYRGAVAEVTADGTNLTTALSTVTITINTTTPGVNPVTELIRIDACVASREFLNRTDAPAYAEGDDAMEIPFSLKKRSDLPGVRITTVCRVIDLAVPTEEAIP